MNKTANALVFALALGTLVFADAGPASAQCSGGTAVGACGPNNTFEGCCDGSTIRWCENGTLCELTCTGGASDCCTPHAYPGCDVPDKQDCICDLDPYCCDYSWDSLCVGALEAGECGGCPGARPGLAPQDCRSTHSGPGCCDVAMQECVCALEPQCCTGNWDATCVNAADFCDGDTICIWTPFGTLCVTIPPAVPPQSMAIPSACADGGAACGWDVENDIYNCIGMAQSDPYFEHTPGTCDDIDGCSGNNSFSGSIDYCDTLLYFESFETCAPDWDYGDWIGYELPPWVSTTTNRKSHKQKSLYLGDPGSFDYDDGGVTVSLMGRSPYISIPTLSDPNDNIVLKFDYWAELGSTGIPFLNDVFVVVVYPAGNQPAIAYVDSSDTGGFVTVEVDLTSYAGLDVQLGFELWSITGDDNNHEGVYIDKVQVLERIGLCCKNDGDCDDGVTCTVDTCSQDAKKCEFDPTGCEGYCANSNPHVMFLQDYSGSMQDDAGNGQSKWVTTIQAYDLALSQYGYAADFGVKLFPSPGAMGWSGCGVTALGIEQPFGATAKSIIDYLYAAPDPPGATPIAGALTAASLIFPAQNFPETDPKYVILITDGADTCAPAGAPEAAVAALADLGISTFVIGFGANVDADVLNEMAVLGGHAQDGDEKYFSANTPQELADILASLLGELGNEVCNGIDDDCDGLTDEDVEPLTCFGVCGEGVQECVNGQYTECQLPSDLEICDGLDQNCNGIADDPWKDGSMGPNLLGDACFVGTGACETAGVYICDPSDPNGPAVCSATEGAGSAEICDGIDNDCDGVVDNVPGTNQPLSQSCYTGDPATLGVGSCTGGIQYCDPLTGTYGECEGEVTPGTETCNGADDDCNNQIDEIDGCCETALDCNDAEDCTIDTCDTFACNNTPIPGCAICGENQGNILFLVDWSSNMGSNSADGQTKWEAMVGGFESALPLFEDTTAMAVKLFRTPTMGGCNVDPDSEEVPFDATADEITNYLGSIWPNGPSPIVKGLLSAKVVFDNHPEFPEGTKFVVLITKGTASCSGDELAAIEFLSANGIQVFVIGYDKAQNAKTLSEMAIIGGHAVDDGGDPYYAADSEGEMEDALEKIAGIVSVGNEFCNGIDDDCDGETDEDVGTLSCLTDCGQGVRHCENGSWGACVAPVDAEVCDGVDNDCNGTIDDPWADLLGTTCTAGSGACANSGTYVCTADGTGVECSAVGGDPSPEDCDGIDNDCDGEIDNQPGTTLPIQEECYDGALGTAGVGICQTGTATCEPGGNWGECVGQTTPQTEVCDGFDNDCDGTVDNSWVDGVGAVLGEACTEGVGACATSGTWQCPASGLGEPECSATPGSPTDEICDGIDNDCDAQIDEDDANSGSFTLTQPCYTGPAGTEDVGECAGGAQGCLGAIGWGTCGGQTLPDDEICDGFDNDCDGLTDEDSEGNPIQIECYPYDPATQGIGACTAGYEGCTPPGEEPVCLNAVGPTDEVCDGIDNDCDGLTDEDADGNLLVQVCYTGPAGTLGVGQCVSGTAQCAGATGYSPTCDNEVVPTDEICDGIDNDCDGVEDVDEPNTAGGEDETDHPCHGEPGCTLGDCICFENQQTGDWGCILD